MNDNDKLKLIDDMIDTFRYNKCRGYTTERERLIASDVLFDDIKAVIGSDNGMVSMNDDSLISDI